MDVLCPAMPDPKDAMLVAIQVAYPGGIDAIVKVLRNQCRLTWNDELAGGASASVPAAVGGALGVYFRDVTSQTLKSE